MSVRLRMSALCRLMLQLRTYRCNAADDVTGDINAKGFHLHVLLKPCVNLSIYTASDVRPPTFTNRQ